MLVKDLKKVKFKLGQTVSEDNLFSTKKELIKEIEKIELNQHE